MTPSDSVGPLLGVLEDQLDDACDLGAEAVVDPAAWSAATATSTWRRHSVAVTPGKVISDAVVDVRVGEGDQPLVAAAVVPARACREASEAAERVEDRLEASACRDAVGRVASSSLLVGADRRRRRRSRSAAAAARRRRRRAGGRAAIAGIASAGRDLAGLVEDDDVEVRPSVGQHLADDERAHRPARLERRQHVRAVSKRLADRQVRRFLAACCLTSVGLVGLLVADCGSRARRRRRRTAARSSSMWRGRSAEVRRPRASARRRRTRRPGGPSRSRWSQDRRRTSSRRSRPVRLGVRDGGPRQVARRADRGRTRSNAL